MFARLLLSCHLHRTRAVGVRENLHRQHSNAGRPDIAVDVLLSFGGELCAVSPGDLLLDLAPQGTKDAVFVACRKGDGDTKTVGLPSPAQHPAAPVTPALAPAPDRTRVSPGANPAISSSNSSAPSPSGAGAGDTSSNKGGECCYACNNEFSTAVPIFCCRGCGKLFHGDCVGYNLDSRQSPPPKWICPCCPDGERGPIERCVHLSLKGLGSVKQTLGTSRGARSAWKTIGPWVTRWVPGVRRSAAVAGSRPTTTVLPSCRSDQMAGGRATSASAEQTASSSATTRFGCG
ncbi:unnamed protein product [Ectocarpus sp. 12 AP-2014]